MNVKLFLTGKLINGFSVKLGRYWNQIKQAVYQVLQIVYFISNAHIIHQWQWYDFISLKLMNFYNQSIVVVFWPIQNKGVLNKGGSIFK